MTDWYTIGEFAETLGLSTKALRHYEKIGLLQAHSRSEKGYRYYRRDQIKIGKSIVDFQKLGFTLAEIKTLLSFEKSLDTEKLVKILRSRLEVVRSEAQILEEQRLKLEDILTSLQKDNKPLSGPEREKIMSIFKGIRIVVTGTTGLVESAKKIQERLQACGASLEILSLKPGDQVPGKKGASILIIEEGCLESRGVKGMNPDIILVRNISDTSKLHLEKFLNLYDSVSSATATILNADDMASIELAKHPQVRKGKIFYFSKNRGFEDQIKKIGGVISDGEEVRIYGHNQTQVALQKDEAPIVSPLGQVMIFDQEIALISSLAALLDVGIDQQNLACI